METANRTTGRHTLTLQLALVLVLFVVLWLGLHAFNPLVDTPGVKAWLKNHLPFLSVDARELLVRHSWQLLVAALVALRSFGRLKPVASFVAQHWMPEFPPFLTRPYQQRDLLESPAQELTLVGRARELKELNAFLTRDDRLSWWWLNGGPGSGKSRLALEWIRSLRAPWMPFSKSGYDAGLFEDYAGVHEWAKQSWKPRRRTVIVVDNAADRIPDIVDFMQYLGAHSPEFRYPVRVLLVERSVPEELMKLHASTRLYQRSYKVDALNVSPLAKEDIRDLNRELGKRLQRVRDLTDSEIQQVVDVSKGLPLFLILALQNLAMHGEIQFEGRNELLRQELLRTLGKMSEQGIDDTYLPLFALATFVRGLSWQRAEAYLQKLPPPKKAVLDRLFQRDTAIAIPPIEPDIVGEIFLLKAFGNLTKPERDRFLQAAWDVSADSVSSMLVKVAMDFPDDPSLAELDRQPGPPDHAVLWGKVRVRLLSSGKLAPTKTDHYLQQLQALMTANAASFELQNVFAQGMASLNRSYRALDQWNESLQSFRGLVDFARANRENIEVQVTLAQAASDVLSFFGPGQHEEELQIALQAQADLSQIKGVQQLAEFQVTMAVTAYRSMKGVNWKSHDETFRYLDDIGRQFPRQLEIQRVVAYASMEALAQWYRDVLDTDPWFGTRGKIDPEQLHGVALSAVKTLERVVDRDTPGSADLHRRIVASVVGTLAIPVHNWQRLDLSLKILEAVAKRYPDDLEIQVRFVEGALQILALCAHFSEQGKKAAKMHDIVRRMKEVVPAQLRQREEIAKSFKTAETYLAKPV